VILIVACIVRTHFQIGGYELEFDREATAASYARVHIPGPEACGCAQCRNWIAARDHLLPSEFRDLLSRLGIPTNGEIEVWETPGQSQPHFYGGWYFVVGRILSGEPGHVFAIAGFAMSFRSDGSFAVCAFEGQEVCELHFHAEVGEFLSEAEYACLPKPKSP
jgi:hypothetical protein